MRVPDPKLALAAFQSVDFGYTRQLTSVWSDPPYHVSDINRDAADDILDYFRSRTRNATSNAPLGRILLGPAGYGKTHLIGELRRCVWNEKGWFVLLDFVGVNDFWSSVALGFLNSLQARMPDEQTQFDVLIIRLMRFLKIQRDLRAILDRHRNDSRELVVETSRLFLSTFARVDRAETLKHRDVITALCLFVSDNFDYNSIAHAWLQGMDLEPDIAHPLGLSGSNSPLKVVEGLSWIMSLVAPTLIAIDQIDAIVTASKASEYAKTPQTKQEEAEAKSIVALLGQGLMDIYDKQRRAVTVVSCLEATWKILEQGTIESVKARYQEPLRLSRMKSREVMEDLVAGRLAPAYKECGFTPPYRSWPFPPKLLEEARNLDPRLFLKRCEDFRLKCIAEGRVSECETFNIPIEAALTPPDGVAARFERYRSKVDVAPLLAPSGEGSLRALLDSIFPLLVKHYELPDSIDAGAQRDPDQKRPSLHGRVSFTFHAEGEREQHYCFRIIEHPNAIAFQSRLKAAMTASGIDTALKFRHLFILRRSALPTGKKTETLLGQFEKAGGKFIAPIENDLRIFAALGAVAKENHPQFEAWLRSAKPLFETELFKTAGLAPPSFLDESSPTSAKKGAGVVLDCADLAPPSFPDEPPSSPKSAMQGKAQIAPSDGPPPPPTGRLIPVGHRFERGQKGAGIFLDAALLPRHVAIIAGSGSGKTVLLRRIVEEATLLGIPAIVLDINNDLSRLGDRWPERPDGMSLEDAERAETYHARADVVIWTPGADSGRPLSLPLLPNFSSIGKGKEANDERKAAIEMAFATLTPYIGASGQKAKLKEGVLADALRSFSTMGSDALNDLIALLSELPDGVSQIRGADKLAGDMSDQLRAAIATNPLLRSDGTKLDPGQLFFGANGKTRISVINFCGLASDAAKQAFVNQLQMTLFTWIKANPSQSGLLYVMDEAQNFVPSQMGTPCLQSAKALAAQARKYGLGMILATQLPKGIDNGIVSNCTTHVYGRMNSPTAITAIEDLIRAKGGEAHDIGKLSRGEFYFSTDGTSRPIKIQSPLCLSWHAQNPPTSQEVIEKARG